MSEKESFIERLERELPTLCTDLDLIELGLYASQQCAYAARVRGNSPPFIKIKGRNVRYPKDGIIEFMKKNQPPKEYTLQVS